MRERSARVVAAASLTECVARSLGLIYLRCMTTHMVAVGGFNGLRTRLDSSLVAKWPDPIDLASDIFIPGKTAAFKSQLMAALQSRDLWSIIASTDPTAITIAEQNPDATRDEVEDALRQVLATRRHQKQSLASLLPGLIKTSSMTYMQNEQLSALVSAGQGVQIWEFIALQIDLRSGVV